MKPLTYDDCKKNAGLMLSDQAVREELSGLLAYYFFVTQRIIQTAAAQNSGTRPRGLENEIYSCFHHVARGVCSMENAAQAKAEIAKGANTHLKRVALDGFKVALRPLMDEVIMLMRYLNELELEEDFRPSVRGKRIVEQIGYITRFSKLVKRSYLRARFLESVGMGERAISAYARTYNLADSLHQRISRLMKTDDMILVQAYHRRADRLRMKELIIAGIISVLSAIVGGIVASGNWPW